MAQLLIKNVPPDLYEALSRAAFMENRNVVQQAVVLLRSALNVWEEQTARRKSVLTEIAALRVKDVHKLPAPAELVREGREG